MSSLPESSPALPRDASSGAGRAADIWTLEPREPAVLARLMEVWTYRRLFLFFGNRAITKLYRKTVLGRIWIFIRPLFPLIVKTLIFGSLLGVQSEGVPYFLFLVVGSAAWDLFAGALMWATRSLEMNRGLLGKVYVPRVILPMAMMTPAVVNFLIYLGVTAVALIYYLVRHGTLYAQGFPPLLCAAGATILILLFAFSVGLWTSVLGANARDVRFTLAYVLDFWFFLTPVLYPLSSVPERWRWLILLNPMAALVEAFKWGVLGIGRIDGLGLAVAGTVIAMALIFGLRFFSRAEAEAVDRV